MGYIGVITYNPLILTIDPNFRPYVSRNYGNKSQPFLFGGFQDDICSNSWAMFVSWKLTFHLPTCREALQNRSAADGWRNVAGSTREIQRRHNRISAAWGKGVDLLMLLSVDPPPKKAFFWGGLRGI